MKEKKTDRKEEGKEKEEEKNWLNSRRLTFQTLINDNRFHFVSKK